MTEHEISLMEGSMCDSEHYYFAARPSLDSDTNRRIFCEGFQRAWKLQLNELKELQSEVAK